MPVVAAAGGGDVRENPGCKWGEGHGSPGQFAAGAGRGEMCGQADGLVSGLDVGGSGAFLAWRFASRRRTSSRAERPKRMSHNMRFRGWVRTRSRVLCT